MTSEPLNSAAAAAIAQPVPPPKPDAASPVPALTYRTDRRAWPWDVRIVIFMGIAWTVLQLLQSALGIAYVTRQKNIVWMTSNYGGWVFVLGILLRSLLPTLLVIGLIGLLKFKRGARRLSVLIAWTFITFGIVELAAQMVVMIAQRTHAYDVPGQVVSTAQNFLQQNAVMIVLAVTLMRRDVRLLARDIGESGAGF
jgi:hypothetical protein